MLGLACIALWLHCSGRGRTIQTPGWPASARFAVLVMASEVMLFDEATSALGPELVGEAFANPESGRLQAILSGLLMW